jgi:hypothetical protein
MKSNIFYFTICTKDNLKNAGCIFKINGDPIGRILSMSPKFNDTDEEFEFDGMYSYDIESTSETFEKIKNKEILLSIKEYTVHKCNTHYHSI